MSDEVRQAMERCQRVKKGDGLVAVYDKFGDMPGRELDKWMNDKSKLAEAYLAEHTPEREAERKELCDLLKLALMAGNILEKDKHPLLTPHYARRLLAFLEGPKPRND